MKKLRTDLHSRECMYNKGQQSKHLNIDMFIGEEIMQFDTEELRYLSVVSPF